MGRKTLSLESRIDIIIKKLGPPSNKLIVRRKRDVFCTSCNVKVTFTDKTLSCRIKEHVSSNQHDKSQGKGSTPLISGVIDRIQEENKKQKQLNERITKAFLAADIPLHKLKNPALRACLGWMSGMKIPHPNTLRGSVVKQIAEDTIDKIRERTNGKDVYLVVDETTDPASRFCTNVMVGISDGGKEKTMLVHVSFSERNDNQTV